MNDQIAHILSQISKYLLAQQVAFKPQAYRRASQGVRELQDDVQDIYDKEGVRGLERIPGVGENIASLIEEYLKTGKIGYYRELQKQFPRDFQEIVSIEGIGPRKARILYEKLGIRTIRQLEKAAHTHAIASLEGFGEQTERNILQGISFVKKSRGRFLLGEVMPYVREIYERLSSLSEVQRIDFAGSVRRKKETIGDADILVLSAVPKRVMEVFVSSPGVEKVWAHGKTKSSVHIKGGFDIDLRVIPKKSYGSALQYFTGSKEHNIALRKIAIAQGYKLSEYGLFRGKRKVAGADEAGIYRTLGMGYIEPELREQRGEIEAAQAKRLPRLVALKDIKGDLHCHSNWDGGTDSLEQIARSARAQGYEYVGIADHTQFLKIEKGLDERQLRKRNKAIDALNRKIRGIRVLKSAEVNILHNGSLDISDTALSELDVVIAGVHSQLRQEKQTMTGRLVRAMKNPHVDIISHPTGRLLGKRPSYQVDIGLLMKVARETKTVLEVNSHPERLDLSDIHIRQAKEEGVRMVINTDAHSVKHLAYMEFGVSQARRGWAEKKDILNTQPLKAFLKSLK